MKRLFKAGFVALGYRVKGMPYGSRRPMEPGWLFDLQFDDVICRHMFSYSIYSI